MGLLDEENFKSIHIVFCSFIFMIIYFCWKSTRVNEHISAHHIPISHNFVRRSSSVISNASTTTTSTTEENLTNSVENITDSIFVEATNTFNQNNANTLATDDVDESRFSDTENLTEEEQIIREMDRDMPTSSSECTLRRRPKNDKQPSTSSVSVEAKSDQNEEDKICIKLKYLNDEIKTVNAYLSESVGNFKRRQFNSELESKLIKLIFNGQILEDDKKSLSQCGIFEKAVVHCLILQKKTVISPAASGPHLPAPRIVTNNERLINSNALEWNGTLFIYILGMVLVCLTLVYCWYCRIQYSSYFSWYSTIGLILMTSLFLVMIPLVTLIDQIDR